MSTTIAPFAGLGINVFNSCAVVLMSTTSDSFCMPGMEPKFEHTSMVFTNLVRSPVDHPRKKALHPIPPWKGFVLELELELLAMERRKSNKMGTDVLSAVDKKGKEAVHLMPEVVLPPTAEEESKTLMVILAPKLECIPMPLDFTKHFAAVPTEFKLKNNTGCSWRTTVKLMNDRVTLDEVIIFDDDGIEVVNKCWKHDEAFTTR
ncbi:Cohesin subunit SA-1 [Hordeum vulgare]|nr:Cohesin subunit SA-1 [Hordeum vulgare]